MVIRGNPGRFPRQRHAPTTKAIIADQVKVFIYLYSGSLKTMEPYYPRGMEALLSTYNAMAALMPQTHTSTHIPAPASPPQTKRGAIYSATYLGYIYYLVSDLHPVPPQAHCEKNLP